MLILCASVAPRWVARYTVWIGWENQGDNAVKACDAVESAQ